MDFDQNIPIYMQIIDLIKRDIISKKLKGGGKLPSVREMAERVKVNPNTIQRVYQELEREGLTYTQRGMGTFITEDPEKLAAINKEMAKSIILTFLGKMKELGFSGDEIIEITTAYLEKGE